MWESGGLRFTREIRCKDTGCPGEYKTDNDHPGVRYYGRGRFDFKRIFWLKILIKLLNHKKVIYN